MHVAFAALFFFAILTSWVPGYWPVTVFQVGVFALAAVAVWRARLSPPAFSWPLVPLSFAVLWGLFQWLTGRTAYAVDTKLATLRWATFLSVFLVGISLFRDDAVRRWFRSAILWFAFLVAVLATVQNFTSKGKVFWLFATPYTDNVMGPILYRNHYAVFIEAVLPIALYLAVRREGQSLLYSGMAAVMYASVIASQSRAGTVLATAEILLVPLLLWALGRATGRTAAATLLGMCLLFAALAAVVGWQSVWSRLWMADPLGVRRELAVSSFHMAASHPWFGTGLGTWPTVYPHYAIVDIGAFANQAHDDWLQWTVEGGIPFGIILTTLFFWSLRPAFRSVWGLGVVAVFLHAIVDYPFSRPALGSWPILILSLLAFTAAEPQDSGSPPIP
ncbi:MAG TPA: O-antigen ligase family protein [Candidatus Acidoferrales bacterium]|nr:O-antigen ligase family protein [Candidatus Acidoferrales bacterium]